MERQSISRIAAELNTSKQALSQMIKRNKGTAPEPDADGKYSVSAVKAFYEARAYDTSESSSGLRIDILEQEYRIKKAKADEYEARFISKELALDMFTTGMQIIESVLKSSIEVIGKDLSAKEKEREYRDARAQFRFMDEFIASLRDRQPA